MDDLDTMSETHVKCDHCAVLCPFCPKYTTFAQAVRRIQAQGTARPPSLLTQAVTFTGAIVTHALAGFPSVAPTELERRLGICRECPDYQPDPPTCGRCNCGLDIKASWAEQRCPLGKWEATAVVTE